MLPSKEHDFTEVIYTARNLSRFGSTTVFIFEDKEPIVGFKDGKQLLDILKN